MAKPKRDPTPAERLLAACNFCSLIENSKTIVEFHNGLIMSRSASGVVLAMPTEQALPFACDGKHLIAALKSCKDGVAIMTTDGANLSVTSGELVTRVPTFPAMLSVSNSVVLADFHTPFENAEWSAQLTEAVTRAYKFATASFPDAPDSVARFASRIFFDAGMVRATNGAAYIETWVGPLPIAFENGSQHIIGALPLDVAKAIVKSKTRIVGISATSERIGFLLDNGAEVSAPVFWDTRLPTATVVAEKTGIEGDPFASWQTWEAPKVEVLNAANRLKTGVIKLRGNRMARDNQEIELPESHEPLTYFADVFRLLYEVATKVLHVHNPEATLFVGNNSRGFIMGIREGEAV